MTPAARLLARRRQRRKRNRDREGLALAKLRVIENKIAEAMITSERLNEQEALLWARVERELEKLIDEWAERWIVSRVTS